MPVLSCRAGGLGDDDGDDRLVHATRSMVREAEAAAMRFMTRGSSLTPYRDPHRACGTPRAPWPRLGSRAVPLAPPSRSHLRAAWLRNGVQAERDRRDVV